jgi:hypothetical protein
MARRVPKAAWKIFTKMCETHAGWGPQEFETLYTGFGFTCRQGRHSVYIHPDHRAEILPATVGRHRTLATGYAETAVKRIKQLISLERLTTENTR